MRARVCVCERASALASYLSLRSYSTSMKTFQIDEIADYTDRLDRFHFSLLYDV